MRFIKLCLLIAIFCPGAKSFAEEVILTVDEKSTLPPIWLAPNAPKVIVLPGDLSRCFSQSTLIKAGPADPQKIGEGESWIREIVIYLDPQGISEKNANTAVSEEVGIHCKFESAPGKFMRKTLWIRVDAVNKYKNQETYVLQPKGYNFMTDKVWRRIKSYSSLKIVDGKAQIAVDESKTEPEPTIKGFKSMKLGRDKEEKTELEPVEERKIRGFRKIEIKKGDHSE